MSKIIGLDPGVHGAYCILSEEGEVLEYAKFPLIEEEKKNHRRGQKSKTRVERYYDRYKLWNMIPANDGDMIAYLEAVHSRPGEGAATSFKFGDCFGQLKMLLTGLGIPVRLVSPPEWCNAMHDRQNKGITAKERSWIAYEQLFTGEASKYAKRPPDGIIDATLIAEYGRRRIVDGMDEWRLK